MKKRIESKNHWLHTLFLCFITLFLFGCGSAEVGTLNVIANGEDFVRDGFVSVDGWAISFDQLAVNVENVTVWRLDEPYDASGGVAPEAPEDRVLTLPARQTADLSPSGVGPDGVVLIGQLEAAPAGHYNAIGWEMPAADGPPLRLVGTAAKDGSEVAFDITVETPFAYLCGEYIGDGRKGFVNPDGAGEIEMTFHLDHVFGDFDAPADDAINTGALGFSPLADVATDGQLTADLATLETALSGNDYERLVKTLQTLGHVGEGHCYEATGGYTGGK